MQSVVVTGSSKGIGYGLAENFLRRGCSVALNGRNADALESARRRLAEAYGDDRVTARAGDVTSVPDLEALWDAAVSAFGRVDIWINNAGVGHPMQMIWELPEATIDSVAEIDVKGTIRGSAVAVRRMLAQGHGHLYNMEGFGSDGRLRAGLSIYGMSKRAVRYLSRSLAAELRDTPVKASRLSPGMVATDFLTDPYVDDPEGFAEAKKIFNILGDRPETVTPWLVDRILSNTRSGVLINYLTTWKILWRFATGWARKRELFDV